MKHLLATLVVALASLTAGAADLTGSVSFANGLYTYNYELSASVTPVTEVLVLVNSTAARYSLYPLSTTDPTGWFHGTAGGRVLDGTDSHYVTWWGWFTESAGASPVTGFSFTTTVAPAVNPSSITYALFSPEYTGGSAAYPNFFVGSVVAPDFLLPEEPPVLTIPEPETYIMLLAGLGLLGAMARRKRVH